MNFLAGSVAGAPAGMSVGSERVGLGVDRDMASSPICGVWTVSGDDPLLTVVLQAEFDESFEIDCGAAVREPDRVTRDSSVSHFAMAITHEPRN